MTLESIGWDEFFARPCKAWVKKGCVPAIIVQDNKISYTIHTAERGYSDAILSGKVYHEAETNADLPAVGDWVAVELGADQFEDVIRARLPRKTCFSRKVPGKGTEQQVIGANVDTVMLLTEPDQDFNLRRVERYLLLVARSGAKPVIVINKSENLSAEQRQALERVLAEVVDDARQAEVHFVSALEREGLEALDAYFGPGRAVSLVGSSGVGKSTLINALTGEDLWTAEVNETTGKGRHTTTWRSVIFLESGGLIIDSPGMRELQMWTDEESLRDSFRDIEQLASKCRFRDCKHASDAGCQVRESLEQGELLPERYDSYLNLETEIAELKLRQQKRQMRLERRTKREMRHVHRNYEDRVEYQSERDLGR